MSIKFIYFDLGKVLIDFSLERMFEQVGAVAGVSVDRAHEILYTDGLMRRHETGRLDSRGMYEAFCSAAGSRPDYDALLRATNEIFTLNLPVLPLVAALGQTGYPLGILSNTCETHWDYCFARFRIVAEGFSVYRAQPSHRRQKPDAAIFQAAAELAGYRPEEIFFVDDIPGHVAGARAVGFDAVQFTTAAALARELRQRGIRFNF